MNTLELTDKEAVILNSLYGAMVAMFNDFEDAAEGLTVLIEKVVERMSDEEKNSFNIKMSAIVKTVPLEALKEMGIHTDGYKLSTLDEKYREKFEELDAKADRNPWN